LSEGNWSSLTESNRLLDVERNWFGKTERVLPFVKVNRSDSSIFGSFVSFNSFFLNEFNDSSLVLEDTGVDGGFAN